MIMKPEQYYETLRCLLQKNHAPDIDDILRYLQESTAESGMSEEEYLDSLGTPQEVCRSFMELDDLSDHRDRALQTPGFLPPLPRDVLEGKEAESVPGSEEVFVESTQEYSAQDSKKSGPSFAEEEPQNEQASFIKEEKTDRDASSDTGEEIRNAVDAIFESLRGLSKNFMNSDLFMMPDASDAPHQNQNSRQEVLICQEEMARASKLNIDLVEGAIYVHPGDQPGVLIHQGQEHIRTEFENGRLTIANRSSFALFGRKMFVELEIIVPQPHHLQTLSVDSVRPSFIFEDIQAEHLKIDGVNAAFGLSRCRFGKTRCDLVDGRIATDDCSLGHTKIDVVNGSVLMNRTEVERGKLDGINPVFDLQIQTSASIQAESVTGSIYVPNEDLAPYLKNDFPGKKIKTPGNGQKFKIDIVGGSLTLR